jgi:hypothetical protein
MGQVTQSCAIRDESVLWTQPSAERNTEARSGLQTSKHGDRTGRNPHGWRTGPVRWSVDGRGAACRDE